MSADARSGASTCVLGADAGPGPVSGLAAGAGLGAAIGAGAASGETDDDASGEFASAGGCGTGSTGGLTSD